MLQALRTLFKKPPVIVGIVTALMFQVIFSVIWMTAYSGVNDRTKELTVAIVNEDGEMSKGIADSLAGTLPFHTVSNLSAAEALDQLNHHQVHMVLDIPAGFNELLQTAGSTAEIKYTINEANPVTIKSMMQGVSQSVTNTINKQATAQGVQTVLTASGAPADQAAEAATNLATRVEGTTTSINPVNGMNNQMVPMMMVLASYVGAMIMGMNLQTAMGMLSSTYSRLTLFGARVVINVGSALVVSLLGSSLIVALGGQIAQGFVAFWLFQALFLCTFMFFSQFFLICFGPAGSLFNIISLSLQLVSSGAMVPRELLNSFYSGIGQYLPATYAVQGILSVQLGGPGVQSAAGSIVIVLLVAVALSLVVTLLKKQRMPAMAPSPAQANN
ncbi:ABC transporter permease [Paenibacillus sp. FSL R5-0766]|uniref:YhgE/Pip domain-containing protein n=1 Tax=unclassified Paenibacillus TaxID=185978 RepID=UPI0006496818|nr:MULTISPECIES: ABC transporter permease [unclassified Paenibacillus]KLU58395.1 ABC transporter [Paenibacillus sp. VT-400]OMF60465.1 ABC transporter [Paenibacillus sp. FSL R5-0765]